MPQVKGIEEAIALSDDNSTTLNLTFGTLKVDPGQYISRKDARYEPELSFGASLASKTYLVICIDLDAPFPCWSFLAPINHWIQPGLKVERRSNGTRSLLADEEPFIVDYAGPGPPPGSRAHRYVFMLYEQPKGFEITKFASPDGKKVLMWPRIRWDLKAFEREANLGPVLASNYFFSN